MTYGKQGVLIPLNGLIDQYAPNLKAMMDKKPYLKEAMTAPDGNIYGSRASTNATTARSPRNLDQ